MKFLLSLIRWAKMTSKRRPVVVVLGATGTGKSKLAVDLATKFNGEVISADSMQVYTGLDILTNKVTREEMKGIPHHMISVVDHSVRFDVTAFKNMALPIVESLLDQQKIPFIVGGTNYYIESLIWKILIDKSNEPPPKRVKLTQDLDVKSQEILDLLIENNSKDFNHDILLPWSNQEVYKALEIVDPERAKKLHPNDRRKVVRSLQVFVQTGRPHSDIISEQVQSVGGSKTTTTTGGREVGGPLRFENVICFWIKAPNEILGERIFRRVDKMIELGLREELEDFMDQLGDEAALLFTQGLLQSIGFKEFDAYLKLPKDQRRTDEGDKLFDEGVSKLKLVTKQYARRQLKWVRQRFLRPSRRMLPPVFWLDGSSTEASDWQTNITSIATNILESYIDGNDDDSLLLERRMPLDKAPDDDMIARTCELCDKILLGVVQWEAHLKSSGHRKIVRRKAEEENKAVEDKVKESQVCESLKA